LHQRTDECTVFVLLKFKMAETIKQFVGKREKWEQFHSLVLKELRLS
jgi:hypothetical protein